MQNAPPTRALQLMPTPPLAAHHAGAPAQFSLRWLAVAAVLIALLVGLRLMDGGTLVPADAGVANLLRRVAASLAWLAGTLLAIRIVNAVLWDWLAPRHST